MDPNTDLKIPEAPKPEEFGLTNADIESLPYPEVHPKALLLGAWVLTIVLFLIVILEWRWIIAISGGFFIGLFTVGMIEAAFVWAREKWRKVFLKGYVAYLDYLEAERASSQAIREYFESRLEDFGIERGWGGAMERRHEENISLISQMGALLEKLNESNAMAVSSRLLPASKSRVQAALFDEVIAAIIRHDNSRLEFFQVGVLETAVFQDIEDNSMGDSFSRLLAAQQTAKEQGIDVSAQSMAEAIATNASSKGYEEEQKMRETIVRETEQLSEKLPYLADLAEQIREHDLGLASDYKQFYDVKI